jgi:hypothetical protein
MVPANKPCHPPNSWRLQCNGLILATVREICSFQEAIETPEEDWCRAVIFERIRGSLWAIDHGSAEARHRVTDSWFWAGYDSLTTDSTGNSTGRVTSTANNDSSPPTIADYQRYFPKLSRLFGEYPPKIQTDTILRKLLGGEIHFFQHWRNYSRYASKSITAFCTSAGQAGLGLDDVRVGDLVVRLHGRAPGLIVLHPHDEDYQFKGFVIMESKFSIHRMDANWQTLSLV